MENENTVACCACLNVIYNPEKHEDGLMSCRWTCKTCGHEFIKKTVKIVYGQRIIGEGGE